MLKGAKRKGTRLENDVVRLAEKHGITGFRHAGSGAFEGLKHDGTLYLPGLGRLSVECKARREGAGRTLEAWADGADILITRADRSQPMVHMPLEMLFQLAACIGEGDEGK